MIAEWNSVRKSGLISTRFEVRSSKGKALTQRTQSLF
jgi:hypothetical protein